MSILEHPKMGVVALCDFKSGFVEPEMVKRRPVVIISPKISSRRGVCTVVALSTTEPAIKMAYHCQIDIAPSLPDPWVSKGIWVKGDMVNTVGFHRLDFFRLGKSNAGKREYLLAPLSAETLKQIRACVLNGLGLGGLTKHLP